MRQQTVVEETEVGATTVDLLVAAGDKAEVAEDQAPARRRTWTGEAVTATSSISRRPHRVGERMEEAGEEDLVVEEGEAGEEGVAEGAMAGIDVLQQNEIEANLQNSFNHLHL